MTIKMDTYTNIWQLFNFPALKLQKRNSFLKLLDVQKCNIALIRDQWLMWMYGFTRKLP